MHGLHHLHAGLEELWIDLHAAALLEPSDGVDAMGRKTGNVMLGMGIHNWECFLTHKT